MGTDITQRKPMALSRQRENSLLSFRVEALTYLAMARQANVSKETLKMFAVELLDFDNEDVAAAIRIIARSPREEGQTAFPDLGTLLGAIKRHSGERQRVAREKKAAEEMKWREEDHRLHPENYISVAEIFDLVLKKRGMMP